jgi:hypothetical protein
MKNSQSQRRPLATLTVVAALSAVLLSACGSKPPGCADKETVEEAKSIILDRWKVVFNTTYKSMFSLTDEQVASFNNALKIEIRDIVSDGYNADAKKHSCTGVFVYQTITGKTYSASRRFTSQATAEGGGKFVVRIEGGESLADGISDAVNSYKATLMR